MVGGIEWSQGIQDAWSRVASFFPKLVGFLAILLVGYLVAKVIARILDKVLEKVGFDRLVERGGVGRALARSQYDASTILSKVVFYAIMLFVLQLAFGIFGPNPISALLFGVISYLPRLFAAILIIVVAAAIAAAVREIVQAAIGGLTYGRVLALVAYGAILAIGIFAALDQLQIAPAIMNAVFYALLAIIAGSAIIAIGGGGIQPMRLRWERALARAEAEGPRIRQESQGAGDRIRERADDARAQARTARGEQRSGEVVHGGGTAGLPAEPRPDKEPPVSPSG
jgi:hypothetical protein